MELKSLRTTAAAMDPDDYYNEVVSLSQYLEDTYYELVRAFRPTWQHCAEAIVLSALSIEAHMNRRIVELVLASKRGKLISSKPPYAKLQRILSALGKKTFAESDHRYRAYQNLGSGCHPGPAVHRVRGPGPDKTMSPNRITVG